MRRALSYLPLLLLGATAPAATPTRADALFAGEIPVLELVIPEQGIKKLAQDPRAFVEFTLKEPGKPDLEHCSIKLKGSIGSFRQINDERPGFSIRTAKTTDQNFHGLMKFQLNNCAQDGSLIHELLGGEIARAAGVPASRCAHAFVKMNGKTLGVYVLKEGFDGEFLRPFFTDTRGHLYDGGLHNDIHPDLELDKGDPKDKKRLTEFSQALREGDPARRRTRLEQVLDVDAYLRHLAVENILVHGDGYSYRANNYRIYEDPAAGKFHFILHGMDNLFGVDSWGQSSPRAYVLASPVAAPLFPDASVTAVAQALWGDRADGELRARFRRQAVAVYDQAIRGRDWAGRTEQLAANLRAKLSAVDAKEAGRAERRALEGAAQVRRRMELVAAQFADVAALQTAGGAAALGPYLWRFSTDRGEVRELKSGQRECWYLRKQADGGQVDLRLPLALEPGRYRLEAEAKVQGVTGGPGLRLRLGGESDKPGLPTVTGSADWQPLRLEFTVVTGDPTLVLELRSATGEAWLDRGKLRLIRLP